MGKDKKNRICIVGDRFESFAHASGAMTLTEFKSWIQSSPVGDFNLIIGQGLSRLEKLELKALIVQDQSELACHFTLNQLLLPTTRDLTHKHLDENIAISEPKQILSNPADDPVYEAWLTIDDACDEMHDHVTGEHIQGSLIAEAARQMVIAVAEKYYRVTPLAKVSFVTHSVSLNYSDYLFPTPVMISLQMLSLRKGLGGNFRATFKIEFIQDEAVRAICEFQFSVLESKVLNAQEKSLAARAVASL
jgi:hypothetical protein